MKQKSNSVPRFQNKCHEQYKPGLSSTNEIDSTCLSILVPV